MPDKLSNSMAFIPMSANSHNACVLQNEPIGIVKMKIDFQTRIPQIFLHTISSIPFVEQNAHVSIVVKAKTYSSTKISNTAILGGKISLNANMHICVGLTSSVQTLVVIITSPVERHVIATINGEIELVNPWTIALLSRGLALSADA